MRKPITLCVLTLAIFASAAVAQDAVEKAKKAMASGNFEQAMLLLEEDYDHVVKTPAALELLCEAAVKAGKYDRAITYSVKLTDLDATRPGGFKSGALAFYYRAEEAKSSTNPSPGRIMGFYEESRSMSTTYLKLKSDDVEMWSLLGQTHYWLEDHTKSVVAFEKCSQLDPKNVDHLLKLARAHRLGGDAKAAAKTLDRSIAIDPTDANLYKAKGDAIGAAGDPVSAAAVYAKALTAKKLDNATAGQCATNIWNILGGKNEWDKALEYYEAWSKASPRNGWPVWYVGWCHVKKSDDATGIKKFKKAWELAGNNYPDAATAAAQCHWRLAIPGNDASKIDMKHFEHAVRWYCKAHQVKPTGYGARDNEPMSKVMVIFIYLANNGHLKDGAGLLEGIALKADSKDWRVLNNLGLYYRDTGGSRRGSAGKRLCKKSADYYVRASEGVVKSPTATPKERAAVLNDTGVLFHFPQYQIKDLQKGIGYYMKALSHDENCIDANENMGLCMNELGKYEEAIPYFKRVLAQPDQSGRRVSRGGLRRAERNIKDN